ncbi:MAG: 50S ribosomal protein L17 [Flavobacteriales bacterium]|nr:50S ribosomal protein L17 [Flavobacteriales bacterium]
MRHGRKVNHLSRTSEHRAALLMNLACSLIEHKRINTTLAKAKALRVYVEPLITKSKTDSTHSRRTVFSYLKNKEAVTELFREIAPKVADRPGGYVRIIRTGFRPGDNSEMAMIELVDFNTIYGKDAAKGTGAAKKRTRRGAAKKKGEEGPESGAEATATATDEAPKAKAPRKKAAPKAEGEEKPKATRKKKSDDEK